jgi:non-lysosomal glucosylceramidase
MNKLIGFLSILLCPAISLTALSQGLWEMPSCSWTRKMGDRQVYSKVKHYSMDGTNPQTMSKKGMPVGGMGTGSFMYNICGSFGPFYMKPVVYEERFLSQAAFHIREEVNGQTVACTLATEDVLPAWNRLKTGDADYKALFPKANFDYKTFQSRISLLQFSPVIKDNYRETSLPVGMFLFKVKNDKHETVKLSFMFTFPNVAHVSTAKNDTLCPKDNLRPCRRGLFNKLSKDKFQTAIIMGADDAQNPVETQNTAWSIATSSKATYVEQWDGKGDGSEIWNDFVGDGVLSNKNLCENSATPSGALCVSVKLKPGEETVIPFALAWYFPLTGFGEGTVWKKRYTEYFPENQDCSTAAKITEEGLKSYPQWLKAVDEWTLPIAENTECPEWLRAGALNELYYQVFGGSFWENGRLNGEKKYGNRPGQHIAGVMECVDYPYLETFDVRHHSTSVTRDLWPQIEKDILLAYSDVVAATTLGACPHDLGSPYNDPINKPDRYSKDYKHGQEIIPGRETTPWSEYSPKFIQQIYMYWKQSHDDTFLDECWLSVVRSFHYQESTDKNNDGITEMISSEYVNNKLFNAVLWIASLEALKEMSVYRNDKEMETLAGYQLAKARTNSEKLFWNEQLGYYQYNETVPFLMADAFIGQRCADIFNLPPVLNEKRMTSHFNRCFDRLVKPLRDYDGDGVGDLGAANILNLEGQPGLKTSEHAHEHEVWTGVSYNLAASMYHWGRRSGDEDLKRKALLTGKGVYMQCWLNDENGFWFGTPEALWFNEMPKARGLMYQRVRGIWELMKEVSKTER